MRKKVKIHKMPLKDRIIIQQNKRDSKVLQAMNNKALHNHYPKNID